MSRQIDKSDIGEVLKSQKKWWLTPVLIALIIIIALIILGGNPERISFIYDKF